MRVAEGITKSVASFALVMALVAFVLGSAPFTPALALAAVAIPIALSTLLLGMRRLSIVTIYWALAAFLSVPLSRWLLVRLDYMLVILAAVGIALSSMFLLQYVRTNSAA